jgi:hypothetical protein
MKNYKQMFEKERAQRIADEKRTSDTIDDCERVVEQMALRAEELHLPHPDAARDWRRAKVRALMKDQGATEGEREAARRAFEALRPGKEQP